MSRLTGVIMGVIAAVCMLSAGIGPVDAESPFGKGSMVWQKCSVCHKPDREGRLEVIEETRKSPEEWKVVLLRMMRLNGAQARKIGSKRPLVCWPGTQLEALWQRNVAIIEGGNDECIRAMVRTYGFPH